MVNKKKGGGKTTEILSSRYTSMAMALYMRRVHSSKCWFLTRGKIFPVMIRKCKRIEKGNLVCLSRNILNKNIGEIIIIHQPAFFLSLGWPDFTRTSRSTKLRDMSPRVRPDIRPAKHTRATHMIR